MQTSIFFKSPAHRERFVATMQQIGKHDAGKLDLEYAAAVYVLTSDLGTWEKAQDYVSSHGIRFSELLEEVDFSHGYLLLVKLAANLFFSKDIIQYTVEQYPEIVVGPVELATVLDEDNFAVAMAAINLRRHGAHLDDFKE